MKPIINLLDKFEKVHLRIRRKAATDVFHQLIYSKTGFLLFHHKQYSFPFQSQYLINICYQSYSKGNFLTCAWRPTPPMNLLNGMISFWAITFLRYVVARFNGIFLIAWAVSRVFYKQKQEFNKEVCGNFILIGHF